MYRALKALRREHDYDVIEMPECGAEGLLVNYLMEAKTVVKFHSPARLIMPFYDVCRTRYHSVFLPGGTWHAQRRCFQRVLRFSCAGCA